MANPVQYLFGDSTPFPLEQNFLETLKAATAACAALLQSDVEVQRARASVVDAQGRAHEELARLDEMGAVLDAAAAKFENGSETTYAQTAAQLRQTVSQTVEGAKGAVVDWRDGVVRAAEQATGGTAVLTALGRLLVEHSLPDTKTKMRWRSLEETAECQVEMTTPIGLEATLAVDVSTHELWSTPVRVGNLTESATLHLEKEGGVLRRTKQVAESLEKYLVTGVVFDAEGGALRVHKTTKEGAPGFELQIPTARAAIKLRRLAGTERGDAEPLDEQDVGDIRRLWDRVIGPLGGLGERRTRLISAKFGGTPVEDLESPGRIAEAIIDSLAPLVRELKQRSSATGELTLKRTAGAGAREELFIREEDLLDLYEGLPPSQRAAFDAFGLATIVRGELTDPSSVVIIDDEDIAIG